MSKTNENKDTVVVGSDSNNRLGCHRRTKPVMIGGLMRCCLATLNGSESLKEEDGEILPCKYCSSSMVFAKGIWGWNHPA